MTTLIAVYNSDGCVGRCDAKCYQAEQADCHCICGGLNHGAGLVRATDNTRANASDWIASARARGWPIEFAELDPGAANEPLFTTGGE